MIRNFVGKGNVKLTSKDFDKIPAMVAYELPNTERYNPIFQFKFMDMYGSWSLVNVVHVKNENDIEGGVVFLTSKIEIDV